MTAETIAEVLKLAREQCASDPDIVFDSDAKIAEGDDNGAFVSAWVWVSFVDTNLDKTGVQLVQ